MVLRWATKSSWHTKLCANVLIKLQDDKSVSKMFEIAAAETVNLAPMTVLDHRIKSVTVSADCRCQLGAGETKMQSLARYDEAKQCKHLKTITAILNCIHCQISSQWRPIHVRYLQNVKVKINSWIQIRIWIEIALKIWFFCPKHYIKNCR